MTFNSPIHIYARFRFLKVAFLNRKYVFFAYSQIKNEASTKFHWYERRLKFRIAWAQLTSKHYHLHKAYYANPTQFSAPLDLI